MRSHTSVNPGDASGFSRPHQPRRSTQRPCPWGDRDQLPVTAHHKEMQTSSGGWRPEALEFILSVRISPLISPQRDPSLNCLSSCLQPTPVLQTGHPTSRGQRVVPSAASGGRGPLALPGLQTHPSKLRLLRAVFLRRLWKPGKRRLTVVKPVKSHQPGTHQMAAGVAAASRDSAVTHCVGGPALCLVAHQGTGAGFQVWVTRRSRAATAFRHRLGGEHRPAFLSGHSPRGGLLGERACAHPPSCETSTLLCGVATPQQGVSARGPAPSAGLPLCFEHSQLLDVQ